MTTKPKRKTSIENRKQMFVDISFDKVVSGAKKVSGSYRK